MTFQEKVKKGVSSKKISPEMQEFAERVDHLRKISKNIKVSFLHTLLDTRRGR